MMSRLILGAASVVSLSVSLVADTLVLRTRIEGQLLSVRNGIIEFEERRGFGRGRRVEVDRADVVRIEFDPPRAGGVSGRPFGMREPADYFFVGEEQGPIRVRATGRLYLGINDDYLNDNSGTFRVVVYH